MTEKLPERLNSDQIGGARNNSPEVKAGFDISRIPDTQKDIIISFGGKITPYIDEQ